MNTKKTVLITGASRGIGYATALSFGNAGYNVLVTCKNNFDCLLELEKKINDSAQHTHGLCKAFCVDHSDFNASALLIDKIHDMGFSIDVLVNNAGISLVELATDLDKDSWENIWNTNVTSVVAMSKACIPDMLKNNAGKIINISSVWGVCGASCETAYSATKGAVNAYTKALAKELAPSNIQVNALACGFIDTEMNNHLSEEEINEVVKEIPADRIGTPLDVASVVLSLANANDYVTGQIINVDGGWI